ncbi:UNVERIFIED_CONTAM: hypothetical protein RMT77_007569 [Armadillidium vulgare]
MYFESLKTLYGLLKVIQIVLQTFLSLILGVELTVGESWISQTGFGLSLVMLCCNICVLIFLFLVPIIMQERNLDIECTCLLFWIAIWIFQYSAASLYVPNISSNSSSETLINYNYELGFVMTSIMMWLQLITVLILIKASLRRIAYIYQNRFTPRLRFLSSESESPTGFLAESNQGFVDSGQSMHVQRNESSRADRLIRSAPSSKSIFQTSDLASSSENRNVSENENSNVFKSLEMQTLQ